MCHFGNSRRQRTIQQAWDVECLLLWKKQNRNRIDEDKLEHFIDYMVSSDIVKDLPYGSKSIKLSSGKIVELPNLIRSLAPSSLIEQYNQFCEAEDIKPLGNK